MFSISWFFNTFKPHIVNSVKGQRTFEMVPMLHIDEFPKPDSPQNAMWIFNSETWLHANHHLSLPEGSILIISDALPTKEYITENTSVSLLAVSLPFLAVLKRVSRLLQNSSHMDTLISEAMYTHESINTLLSMVSHTTDMDLFLLDAAGHNVFASGQETSASHTHTFAPVNTLYTSKSIPLDMLSGMLSRSVTSKVTAFPLRHFSSSEGERCYICTIGNPQAPCYLLCAIPAETEHDFINILYRLYLYIQDALTHNYTNDNLALEELLRQSIETPLNSEEQLAHFTRRLPYPIDGYFVCVVMKFSYKAARPIPYSFLMQQLETLLPDTNMVVYGEEIVILLPGGDIMHSARPITGDLRERLSSFAARNNAYFGVSNASKNFKNLSVLYRQAIETLPLALSVAEYNGTAPKVMCFNEYRIYHMIQLCAEKFIDTYGSEDVPFLCHPAAIKLTRYDQAHNTDLMDVLFAYLEHNCNVKETANALFMHRNTVMHRLDKIESVLGVPLNPDDQYELYFSCMLLKYYRSCMHKDIH